MANKITSAGRSGIRSTVVRQPVEAEAEALDPFAMGWDAAANLDDPPANPFTNGLSAKLWRQGFSSRVDDYIRKVKSQGGLNAAIV